MDVLIEKVDLNKFSLIAKDIHLGSFGEIRAPDYNRFSYALVAYTNEDKSKLVAYSTVLEVDKETAYMQHGAGIGENKLFIVKAYLKMLEFLKSKYALITTKIQNTNIAMIKLALQAGFLIHGVEFFQNSKDFVEGIFVNLKLENELFLKKEI